MGGYGGSKHFGAAVMPQPICKTTEVRRHGDIHKEARKPRKARRGGVLSLAAIVSQKRGLSDKTPSCG